MKTNAGDTIKLTHPHPYSGCLAEITKVKIPGVNITITSPNGEHVHTTAKWGQFTQ